MDNKPNFAVRALTSFASMLNKVPAVRKGLSKPANNAAAKITPVQLDRIAQDAATRKAAIAEAERAYFPYRYKMQQMFLNTTDNGHISSCMERRKDLTLLRDWMIGSEVAGPGGIVEFKPDDDLAKLFNKTWFTNFLSHSLDAIFYGYTLIDLNDIINDEFKKLCVVKRWNVSPDRYEVTSFPYMPTGIKFLTDERVKDWYVYIDTPNSIGTSPCGYGLLYDVSIYEIFLRNLLGFNGTFVELFAQPFRWGKTSKTSETERAEFAEMLQNIGSSGWGMGDPDDEIEFKETALGGTGYNGYDNLESRLQKIISKLILGHADALDSTPGKLGSGGDKDSPTAAAMRDKQTKDGTFIENVVNDLLIPTMRNLGFNIPMDARFKFKNDAEVMSNANNVADLAVKIADAGLQIDAEYFTEQTKIPVTVANQGTLPGPTPEPGTRSIQARLKKIYNAHKH